jgi:uncharacterized protein (DUF885 family)
LKSNSFIGRLVLLTSLSPLTIGVAVAGELRAADPVPAAATAAPAAITPPAAALRKPATAVQQSFDAFTDALAADWMRANPTAATSQQYFSGAEQDALDRELTAEDPQFGMPLNAAALSAFISRAQRGLDRLRGYSLQDLTPVQRVSAAMLEWQLGDAIRMAKVADQRFVFDQFRGLQVGLVNFLSQVHPVRSARDVDNYLARLRRVAPVLDEGIEVAKLRADNGTLPPTFILRATIEGIDRFLAAAPADNVLVVSLATRSKSGGVLGEEERDAAVAAAQKIVTESIRPAFERVRALLADQLPRATDDAGLWRLPNGAEGYAAALHVNTTTELSAAKIHELGLHEVARISAEMDRRLRALGYKQGSVEERYKALDESLQPPPAPDPRPMLLEAHERILRDAEVRAGSLFDLRPRAPVQVLREPPFTEKNAAAHYSAPAPDGSRPGTVWIPLPGPEFGMLTMRTLTYHEGVPGHHFQIALQQESTEIPMFRRKRVFGGLSAFAEGWALYAEQLAVESGWYKDDPKGRIGQLYDELFRARRLVVDTGLHAQHWTRQQAIDYGIPVAEVERYVVMPGQACAYKLGELEIVAQRSKARKALGKQFSLKKFHNLLLQTGTVPLAVLAQVVDADIAQTLNH